MSGGHKVKVRSERKDKKDTHSLLVPLIFARSTHSSRPSNLCLRKRTYAQGGRQSRKPGPKAQVCSAYGRGATLSPYASVCASTPGQVCVAKFTPYASVDPPGQGGQHPYGASQTWAKGAGYEQRMSGTSKVAKTDNCFTIRERAMAFQEVHLQTSGKAIELNFF
jgi:hypothetical protein